MKRSLMGCILLALAACDGSTVRDEMGLTHRAPDEFRVVSRPPLSVPPEFNLRPPATIGEVSAGTTQPSYMQAQSLVSGAAATPADAASGLKAGNAATAVQPVTTADLTANPAQGENVQSPAEAEFLQSAGAAAADSTIREKLQQDIYTQESKGTLEKLRSPSDNQPVVDAEGETARLKADKDAGQPPTAGNTPMDTAKDNGTLGRIFGY